MWSFRPRRYTQGSSGRDSHTAARAAGESLARSTLIALFCNGHAAADSHRICGFVVSLCDHDTPPLAEVDSSPNGGLRRCGKICLLSNNDAPSALKLCTHWTNQLH